MFLKLLFTPGICETDLKSTHSGEECNSPAVAELWGCPMSFMDSQLSTSVLEIEEPYISRVLYRIVQYVHSDGELTLRVSQDHSRTKKGTELLISLFVPTTY